jgi:methylated-DNA-[protein]-cysteine S-methyltransferase
MANFRGARLAGFRRQGHVRAMNETRQHMTFNTAAGACGLAWSPAGLTHVQLPEATASAAAAQLSRRARSVPSSAVPDWAEACAARMQAYFEGDVTGFADVALDFTGVSEFEARAYTALRRIGWGEVTRYGALAKALGVPGAARAIGAAMARNPWPLIVPCHRVLAASGKIGGFSARGGAETKRRLLQLERSVAAAAAPDLPGLFD